MEFKRKSWGWYLVLCQGKHFKVKILKFKRGGKISHQKHEHRDEIWCWLKGMGRVKNSEKQSTYGSIKQKGDFIYIPKGHWHHYKAILPTTVLEIQTGKCEEEDIERA